MLRGPLRLLISRLLILRPPLTSPRRPNQLFIVIELLKLLVPVNTLGHLGGPPLVLVSESSPLWSLPLVPLVLKLKTSSRM